MVVFLWKKIEIKNRISHWRWMRTGLKIISLLFSVLERVNCPCIYSNYKPQHFSSCHRCQHNWFNKNGVLILYIFTFDKILNSYSHFYFKSKTFENEVWNTEMSQTQDTYSEYISRKYIPKTSEACDPSFSLSSNLPLWWIIF